LPTRPRLEVWWQNYAEWPLELLQTQADVVHIVDQGLLWYGKFLRSGRRLGTVHDLIRFLPKEQLPFAPVSLRADRISRECIRQLGMLDHIISVSRFTADCLVREMQTPASRITVIPNHVDSRFAPPLEEERSQNRRKWFGEAEYAVIHVGRPLQYKNRSGAIRAFALLRERLPGARMFLINGASTEEERKIIGNGSERGAYRFIPAVGDDELKEIYGAADVLVFPSYYEGFGWPPAEAMACGCPVVSSTRASLREVVGDAALTVEDPDDHERIAALLYEVLSDSATSSQLREKGLERALLFAPEKALKAVAAVYRELG
jgi:glycosyltransferase involved in cell wall biosynthesis